MFVLQSNSLSHLSPRSLFARRVKDNRPVEQKDPGWKLFGKVPLREGPVKDPKRIQKVEIFLLHVYTRSLSLCLLTISCLEGLVVLPKPISKDQHVNSNVILSTFAVR